MGDYKSILKEIKPLKIIEGILIEMEKEGKDNPEILPMHYKFVSGIIELFEKLKKEIADEMAS